MLVWITTNFATILVCLILLAIAALIITHLIRNKRRGKTPCGCDCAACAPRGSRHQNHWS